jgi:hypothetical protein
MKNVAFILFLLFTMPMVVFAQSPHCFETQEEAQTEFPKFEAYCSDFSGTITRLEVLKQYEGIDKGL